LALKLDGTLWAWGGGILTPKKVDFSTDLKMISPGETRTYLIKTNGSVWYMKSGSTTVFHYDSEKD
jgi:hypothetical protein